MPWIINDKKGLKNYHLNAKKTLADLYDAWIPLLTVSAELHIKNAVENTLGSLGKNDTHFELLSSGKKGQPNIYSVRFSQEDRIVLEHVDGTNTIAITRIGGHY